LLTQQEFQNNTTNIHLNEKVRYYQKVLVLLLFNKILSTNNKNNNITITITIIIIIYITKLRTIYKTKNHLQYQDNNNNDNNNNDIIIVIVVEEFYHYNNPFPVLLSKVFINSYSS